jgi:hypothetical protein
MALSENEQRLLEQMEAALAAEDPKLANTLRGTTKRWHRRRAVFAGIGFVAGLACLIAGMQVHPVVSVVGFVMMLAAAVVGVSAWQQSGLSGDGPGGRAGGTERDFMGRLEDRWRRHQDDGL